MIPTMKAILTLIFALVTASCFAQSEPVMPNLKEVHISTSYRPLTNCVILKVTPNGITFKCDQGMVQVPFVNLPPEFGVYRPKAGASVAPTTSHVTPQVKGPAPTPKKAPKEKTAVELAQEAKSRANQIGNLKAQIAQHESLISRYDKQSLIGNPNPISTEDYNLAKAKVEEARRKLSEMGG